ncbi:hypothetical protein MVES_002828 [Malassezia vespertilionis]|uniref:Uncharacterized protein n=1 Tax=Malassezia vespertilionis TaxID=2020962 RepID=A0A2N1J9M1_9BASI|nr:hypothetical protein MVES_002828 [Malassezia vespertilionis]
MVRYLIGRYADPLFGVATGVAAYFIWERENATERPPGHTLVDLVRRKVGADAQPSIEVLSKAPAPAPRATARLI